MKRMCVIIVTLLCLLSACVAPGKTSTGSEVCNYEIQTIIYKAYELPYDRIVLFKFSRPVFAEPSDISTIIDQVFDVLEADFMAKMDEEIEKINFFRDSHRDQGDYADIDNPIDIEANYEYPWYYTELCTASYEKDGIISFVLDGRWYMGGVGNSWKTGRTFDFNSGVELKISDILLGDEAQITELLVNEFYEWLKERVYESELTLGEISEKYWMSLEPVISQSGLNANFYLADDGVHIFYEPYTIHATQNGIDIVIAWERAEILRLIG